MIPKPVGNDLLPLSVCTASGERGGIQTYFLWLSVSVMPCEDTLKCTTVAAGGEVAPSVSDMALATAWGPVRDSISTELM